MDRDNYWRWCTVAGFATAMAWVEAAVVYYLRTMLDRIEPYQPNPLPHLDTLGAVELVREVSTLLMLVAVGILAGRTWRSRLGYAALAFGVWDIAYYLFLKLICGWPHSLFDWDILFLIPLPWWGPVAAPVSIAVLMVLSGTLSVAEQAKPLVTLSHWKRYVAGATGAGLALYVFMADALRAMPQGREAVRAVLPSRFNWFWFAVAFGLMAIPLAQRIRQNRRLFGVNALTRSAQAVEP
jgi:hypothetical protein